MKLSTPFVVCVTFATCYAARPILWDADDDRSEVDPPSAAAEAGNLLGSEEQKIRHHGLSVPTPISQQQTLPHQQQLVAAKPLEYAQMQLVAGYKLSPNSKELVPMLVERHYVASTSSKLTRVDSVENGSVKVREDDLEDQQQPPEYPLSEKLPQQSNAVIGFKHKTDKNFLPLSETERRRRAAAAQQYSNAFQFINDTDRTNMALMHAAAAQSSYAYQTLPFMLMFALFNQNRSSSPTAVMAQDQMSSGTADGSDTSSLYGTSLPSIPEHMMGRNNQQEQGIVSIDPSLYGGDNTQAMKHLLQKLLDRQDRRIRPNLGGEPVKVGITMFITTISKINEGEMDYTVDFYFRQYWKDHRLAFNASFLRDKYVSVGSEFLSKIWVPDTFFPNEKRSYFHDATTTNKFIRISPDGSVYNSVRMTVTASCPMNLTYFPMDRQRCKIEIESYGYGVNDILYYWQPQDPKASAEMDDIELPQFIVWPKGACHNNTVHIVLASGKYSRLVCEFLFVRSMGYYLIQIYIPAGLIVIISWVSFWLSRDSTPARVALGVTVVLAMTTLMSGTTASLPKVSYVKSIDVYLGTCFVMVFASLLEYAAVGYTAKRMKMRRAREKLREHITSRFRAGSFAATRFFSSAHEVAPQPPPPLVVEPTLQFNAAGLERQQDFLNDELFQRGHGDMLYNSENRLMDHLGGFDNSGRDKNSGMAAAARDTLRRESLMHPKNTEVRFKNWSDTEPSNHQTNTVNLRHHSATHGAENEGLMSPNNNNTATTAASNAGLDPVASKERNNDNEDNDFEQDNQARFDMLESGMFDPDRGGGGFQLERGDSMYLSGGRGGHHSSSSRRRREFNPSEIDKYSRIVFPLAFVAFNIVYWFAYLHVANMVDKEMIYSYSDLMNNNNNR